MEISIDKRNSNSTKLIRLQYSLLLLLDKTERLIFHL